MTQNEKIFTQCLIVGLHNSICHIMFYFVKLVHFLYCQNILTIRAQSQGFL